MANNYEKFLQTRTKKEESLEAGKTHAWVPDKHDGFIPGWVKGEEGKDAVLETRDGTVVKLPKEKVSLMNPPKFWGSADMSELSHLNDGEVLNNLKCRYMDNRIHTYSGLFLVVVNPYQYLPIYDDNVTDLYQNKRREDIAPHIFTVADEAYRAMLDNQKDQSILITGESGAGKTVNTKLVIKYMATIGSKSGKKNERGQLEEQILVANPILESFGNAKTTRNDNSSRFGKFIQVQFTKQGFIAGASIKHYLLEKSRITFQLKGERNYHCFYQLLAGAGSTYKMAPPDTYEYLKKSECYEIKEVDDAKEFQALKDSMSIVGISAEDQEAIFRIIAGLLNLGNVPFTQTKQEQARLADRAAMDAACELFRVKTNDLETSLIKNKISAGGQVISKELTAAQAAFGKEALAKSLYSRMFDWLVTRINKTIDHDARKSFFLGVLDIAGFEIFTENSFEQLCINYTNEKLQQFFNEHMFKLEQEEYIREKIEWSYENFGSDLQATLDLIEGAGNLLSILDEECVFPKANDDTFLAKVVGKFKGNEKFDVPKKGGTKIFILKHYAGDVPYSVADWLTKNKDPLHEDVINVMKSSVDPFIQSLFWTDAAAAAAGGRAAAGAAKKSSNLITVSSQYKGQLFSLLAMLKSTSPHFIRCIKPNEQKAKYLIDADSVLEQLRCNGVLEGIRIARKGYPNRMIFPDFKNRYSLLAAGVDLPGDPRSAAERILTFIKFPTANYQVGRTKVFFKAGKLAEIESLREQKWAESAVKVQRAFRRYLFKRNLRRARSQGAAANILSKNCRIWLRVKQHAWNRVFGSIKPLLKPNKIELDLKEKIAEFDKLLGEHEQLVALKNKIDEDLKAATNQIEKVLNDKERLLSAKNSLEGELQETKNELAAERSAALQKISKNEEHISDLNNKLGQATQTRTNLEKNLTTVQTELAETNARLEESNQSKASLEKAKNALNSQIEQLNARIEELQNEVAKLKAAKDKLEGENKGLKSSLETETRAKNDAQKSLESATAELEDTKNELARVKKDKEGLERAKKTTEARLQEVTEELESGGKNLSSTEEAKKKLSFEVQELQSQIDEISNQKSKLEEVKRQHETEIDNLKNVSKKEAEGRVKAEKATSAANAEIETFKAQIEDETRQKQALEKAKKKVESEIAELKLQLEQEENAKGATDKIRKKLEGDVRDLEAKVISLEDRLNSKDEEIRQAQNELEDVLRQLEMESKVRITLEKARDASQAKYEELREEVESKSKAGESSTRLLRREMDLLREQFDEEQELRARSDSVKRDLEIQVQKLQQDLSGMVEKGRLDKLQKESQAEIESLKAKISGLEADVSKAQKEAAKAKSEAKEAQAAVETEQAAKNQAEAARKKAESAAKQLQADLDNFLASRAVDSDRVRNLESELNAAREEAESVKASSKSALDKAKKQLNQELEEVREQLEEAEAAKSKVAKRYEGENRELRDQVESLEEEKSKLSNARSDLELQLNDLRRNLEAAGDKAKIEEAKKMLAKELDGIKAELASAIDSGEKLKNDKTKLSKEIKDLSGQLADANAAKTQAENEARRAQKDAKEKGDQLNAVKLEAQDAIESERRLKAQVDELSERADEADADKQRLEGQIKKLRSEIANLEEKLAEAEENKGSANAAKQLASLRKDYEEKCSALDDAEEKASRAENTLRDLDAELQAAMNQLDAAEKNTQKAEKALKSVTTELAEVKENLELEEKKRNDLVRKAKEKLQGEIDSLTRELEREKKDKYEAVKKSRAAAREVDDTKAQMRKLMGTMSTMAR